MKKIQPGLNELLPSQAERISILIKEMGKSQCDIKLLLTHILENCSPRADTKKQLFSEKKFNEACNAIRQLLDQKYVNLHLAPHLNKNIDNDERVRQLLHHQHFHRKKTFALTY